jgi:hypothetical protein
MRADPSVPSDLIQVLADPGLYVSRRHDLGPESDESETLPSWQARALMEKGMLLPPRSAG